ncbi:MAG: dTMP kinase [Candidatus Aenigmarchaeota archaeon]|jgi:dTMP kinase|nr:dTMP kinase [Candidatus Aenigmarchaeota archaeon]
MKGKFIVFEGIDGAGLTTQAELLEKYLKEKKYEVVLTKEPTNSLIGGIIRAALKKEWLTSNRTLQLLFSADRSHHIEKEIIPALESGKIVICDRYFISTIAYGMIEVEKDWLKSLNSKFLLPDIIFIIDVPVEVSIERIKASRFGFELFEEKKKLEKIRNNFLELSKEYKNCFVINGNRSIEDVHKEIVKIVEEKLKL